MVCALALSSVSFGAALGVGGKAPALRVEKMVKGKAVDLSKGVHVVEFWATWCGPCKTSIPHLTELAKRYKGKVSFTGVSVWENGEDQLGQVAKFVKAMGPRMDYNVAFDGKAKSMAKGYMEAAGQNGIPAAFLVKNGKVLWIGHPMDGLDKIVDRVLTGHFNLTAAKAEAARQASAVADEQRRATRHTAALALAQTALDRGDYAQGLKELDRIDASKDPALAHKVLMKRFYTLARTNDARLREIAQSVISERRPEAEIYLSAVAFDLVDPSSEFPVACYPIALMLSEKARAIAPQNPRVLETYARVLAKNGRLAQAVAVQDQAIERAKADPKTDPNVIQEWIKERERMREASGLKPR